MSQLIECVIGQEMLGGSGFLLYVSPTKPVEHHCILFSANVDRPSRVVNYKDEPDSREDIESEDMVEETEDEEHISWKGKLNKRLHGW